MSGDPYIDLDTGVLRNRLGVTDAAELAQLARDAGHPIRWAGMDPTVNVVASQAAHRGNNGPLRAMLNELVNDTVDARDVPGERAPASEVPTVARVFEAPAPRMPGDNEPRRRPGRGDTSAQPLAWRMGHSPLG